MSTIPPNWLGSIIQTQGAASRAVGQRQTEEAPQAERAAAGPFASQLQDVIENTDRDTQVYADSEGTGSQGRPFEQPAEQQEPECQQPDADQSPPGLDVQA